jgi:hypothetical protein
MPVQKERNTAPRRKKKTANVDKEGGEDGETGVGACTTGVHGENSSSRDGESVSSKEVSDGRSSSDSSHSGFSTRSSQVADTGSQLTVPSFGTDNAAVKLTSSNSVCTGMTAEQSYREHQADVGVHLCMKNLREIAKKRGTNEVFRLFKFPPKERDTNRMKLFKVAVLKSMGMIPANNITKDKFDKASEKLKELLPSVKVGMRNKRATVIEACDLEIQRTYAGSFSC